MLTSKLWVYEQARSLLDRVISRRVEKKDIQQVRALSDNPSKMVWEFPALIDKPVIFETGYGPSGLPHIGTFGEVARTSMVRLAFNELTDNAFKTRLICFSDDLDGFRRVPDGVPNADMLAQYLNKPLTSVPDPYGKFQSFGEHNNAMLREFLDSYDFEYEFLSATECYTSGMFDEKLLLALRRFDQIQSIILPTLGGQGGERADTYSCFLPICPVTGDVLQVPTVSCNVEAGTIVYNNNGELVETPVTGGNVKLQWKPDWAMRWAALGVDYEMYGKDLIESATLSSRICKVLDGDVPNGMFYEMFLDEEGHKISKSKGNGLTIDQWLRYGPRISLSYYMFQNPKSAKKLHVDVIPRAIDDLMNAHRTMLTMPVEDRHLNPAFFALFGGVTNYVPELSFSLLLNLVSVANSTDSKVVSNFLYEYNIKIVVDVIELVEYAINYYQDVVMPTKVYLLPTEDESQHLQRLIGMFEAYLIDGHDSSTAEELQTDTYTVGKEAGYTDLKLWFKMIYQTLFGEEVGPRFGTFAKLYGVRNTIDLMKKAIAGELVQVAVVDNLCDSV